MKVSIWEQFIESLCAFHFIKTMFIYGRRIVIIIAGVWRKVIILIFCRSKYCFLLSRKWKKKIPKEIPLKNPHKKWHRKGSIASVFQSNRCRSRKNKCSLRFSQSIFFLFSKDKIVIHSKQEKHKNIIYHSNNLDKTALSQIK